MIKIKLLKVNKKKIFFLIFLISFQPIQSRELLQRFFKAHGNYAFYPVHPMAEKQTFKRLQTDSVVYRTFDKWGKEIVEERTSHTFRLDPTGLVEVKNSYATGVIKVKVYTYASDGRLLKEQIGHAKPLFVTYAYDKRNRIASTTLYNDAKPADTLVITRYTYLDAQTVYTDSGYFHATLREEYTKADKGWNLKQDTLRAEYVFDSQKRLIRTGSDRFEYLLNGDLRVLALEEERSDWLCDHLFDQAGWHLQDFHLEWKGTKWEVQQTTKVQYYFRGAPLRVTDVASQDPLVVAASGGIQLASCQLSPLELYVYAVDGQLVRHAEVKPGQLLALPRGLYFVKTETASFKVSVY